MAQPPKRPYTRPPTTRTPAAGRGPSPGRGYAASRAAAPARPEPPWVLHRPVARAALQCLYETFVDGSYADKAIERQFKASRKLGGRDRRFVAETVYEMTRWWRLLWRCLGEEPEALTEVALWRLLGAHLLLRGRELPDWPEFAGLTAEKPKILDRRERSKNVRAIRHSIPDWMDEQGAAELGERWDEAMIALNKQAPVVLRANSLKATTKEVIAKLKEEEIEAKPAPGLPDALLLTGRKNIFRSLAFKHGMFEVQDGASQRVAPMVAPQPGERVIDACAGAGGKSLHLAAMMGNKGKILAFDIHQRKLDELKRRAARAGADTIEARLIEAKTIKRMAKSADRVLLDVPCSGLGVLRRNPDAKWKLQPEELARLRALQAEILSSYSEMTKVGGRLVYATCSFLPSENEKQVEAFLAARPGEWRLLEEMRNFPGEGGFDGFYAAVMERVRS